MRGFVRLKGKSKFFYEMIVYKTTYFSPFSATACAAYSWTSWRSYSLYGTTRASLSLSLSLSLWPFFQLFSFFCLVFNVFCACAVNRKPKSQIHNCQSGKRGSRSSEAVAVSSVSAVSTMSSEPSSSSMSSSAAAADTLAYFEERVLPRAAKAAHLSNKEVDHMFGWAHACDQQAARRPGMEGDAVGGGVCAGAESSLLRALLNNPRLARSALERARERRESRLGYPDVDLRAALAQRRDVRRIMVALAGVRPGGGDKRDPSTKIGSIDKAE